jgi:hypothetical protein
MSWTGGACAARQRAASGVTAHADDHGSGPGDGLSISFTMPPSDV